MNPVAITGIIIGSDAGFGVGIYGEVSGIVVAVTATEIMVGGVPARWGVILNVTLLSIEDPSMGSTLRLYSSTVNNEVFTDIDQRLRAGPLMTAVCPTK